MIANLFYFFVGKEDEKNNIKNLKNKIVRKMGSYIIPILYKIFPLKKQKVNNNAIVTLTTYGVRSEGVWITIESLMRQKKYHCQVVLWLSEDEFSETNLPKNIDKLQRCGLRVEFCKDIKSYKKIYYCAKQYIDRDIITVDDDCIYSGDFLKQLLDESKKYSDTVCCYRANRMKLRDGNILPYVKWENADQYSLTPRKDLVATGCGGVLYPKGFFRDEDLSDLEFYRVAPFTDDLWLKILEIKNNYKVCQIIRNYVGWIAVKGTKETALYNKNVGENKNDFYLKKLIEFYNIDIKEYLEN